MLCIICNRFNKKKRKPIYIIYSQKKRKDLIMYTMENWENDGTLKVHREMLVSDEVVAELRDCVPPTYVGRGIFQVGEPSDHDEEGEPLYHTFVRKNEGWECMGICREGETIEREGICSKYL